MTRGVPVLDPKVHLRGATPEAWRGRCLIVLYKEHDALTISIDFTC